MIKRPRRTAPILYLALCFPALSGASQQTERPTTAKDVIMTTKTPLGEASIMIPAGTAVDDPGGEKQEILLREGPFSAVVKRHDLVFPVPSPTAPPGPDPTVASPTPEPASVSVPAVSWADPDAASGTTWPADWRILIPAAAAIFFGLYSIFATVALLRRRKRHEYED